MILGGTASSESVNAGGSISTFGHGDAGQTTNNSSEFKVALLDSNGEQLLDSSGQVVYRRMTSDEYFMHFFGNLCPTANAANRASDCKAEAKITVMGLSKGYICDSDCDENMFSTKYALGKRIFWITENGIRINTAITIGTAADPVLIIIMNNGEVKINGNATINGVVYVDVPLLTESTVNCSCTATDSALTNNPVYGNVDDTANPIYGNDTSKPIYTKVTSGGTKCNSNSGCIDSLNNKILKNEYYITTYQQKIIGYQQKVGIASYNTIGSTWTIPVYSLTVNANNVNICTISACTSAATKCTPANPVTYSQNLGDTVYSSCSYSGIALSGADNSPVEIEVLGTWDNSGGGGVFQDSCRVNLF